MTDRSQPDPQPPGPPAYAHPYEPPYSPPFSAPVGGSLDGSGLPLPSGRPRPWWGLGDVILGFIVFFIAATVGLFVGFPFTGLSLFELLDGFATGSLDLTSGGALLPMVATSLLAQQAAMAGWAVLVARWKGFGPVRDWRLRFQLSDLWYGLGVGLIGLALTTVVSLALTRLVGLTDPSAADNTAIITAAEGSPWLWVMVFGTVVGAPVSEEIFFRGLALRSLEKRLGTAWAIPLSALVFSLPHFINGGVAGSIVLLGSIFVVGVVLAAAAIHFDRLGPSIVAHMVFNGVSVAAVLGALGSS